MFINFFLDVNHTLKSENFIEPLAPAFQVSDFAHLQFHAVDRLLYSGLNVFELCLILFSFMSEPSLNDVHFLLTVLYVLNLIVNAGTQVLSDLLSEVLGLMGGRFSAFLDEDPQGV